MRTWACLGGFVMAIAAVRPVFAQSADGRELTMTSAVVVEGVGGGGRTLIQTDAVEALRVTGAWKTPRAGETVALADGTTRAWDMREAGDDGWLRVRGGGYALWTFEAADERVMILEAAGHGGAIVNGEPRTGDAYEFGFVRLPVVVKKGVNEILLKSGRGRVRATLKASSADVFLSDADITTPDLLSDKNARYFGGIVVVNATRETLTGAVITVRSGSEREVRTTVPSIPPLSVRKVRMDLVQPGAAQGEITCNASIDVAEGIEARAEESVTFKVGVRKSTDKHKRTFISEIDGSVQYFSVVPPPEGTNLLEAKAVILSLHGASVEATNQANCYKQRDWCYVICPTNRRTFGFDWEDWGRMDAMEVLAHARELFKLDDDRTYLTGHSMGGHGTWNIGVQFPGTFAALGPSAGWISFWSYMGGAKREGASPVEEMLLRATCTSDTLAMKRNFASQGVYILHGDADDNVPVDQARTMRKELAEFHRDFAYYEEPGAGHWWGDQCVDWDPMIDFFQRRAHFGPGKGKTIDFTTVNVGVSNTCGPASIVQQQKQFVPSRVKMSADFDKKTIVVTTENVRVLEISRVPDVAIEVDGHKVVMEPGDPSTPRSVAADLMSTLRERFSVVRMMREGDAWTVDKSGRVEGKTPKSNGLFKNAFRNRVILAYSTAGTAEENAWSEAKARYDAETFWYRGNGSMEVMADTTLKEELENEDVWKTVSGPKPDDAVHRNVILYGNADTNAAWGVLMGGSPVQIGRGFIRIGDNELRGDDLALLTIRPRQSEWELKVSMSVGVVGGTGVAGMKLTDRLPYFVSGVGIPDWVVMSPELLTKGAEGVKGAGLFGNDWTVENGEGVWRE